MNRNPSRNAIFSLSILLLASALLTIGCPKKGPVERAGEKVDQGIEKVGESLEKAGDKIEDATKR